MIQNCWWSTVGLDSLERRGNGGGVEVDETADRSPATNLPGAWREIFIIHCGVDLHMMPLFRWINFCNMLAKGGLIYAAARNYREFIQVETFSAQHLPFLAIPTLDEHFKVVRNDQLVLRACI